MWIFTNATNTFYQQKNGATRNLRRNLRPRAGNCHTQNSAWPRTPVTILAMGARPIFRGPLKYAKILVFPGDVPDFFLRIPKKEKDELDESPDTM